MNYDDYYSGRGGNTSQLSGNKLAHKQQLESLLSNGPYNPLLLRAMGLSGNYNDLLNPGGMAMTAPGLGGPGQKNVTPQLGGVAAPAQLPQRRRAAGSGGGTGGMNALRQNPDGSIGYQPPKQKPWWMRGELPIAGQHDYVATPTMIPRIGGPKPVDGPGGPVYPRYGGTPPQRRQRPLSIPL